ncbi:MAG: DUF86 domain-containing protein [Actinomycetales bacterium]|nr:DUF86 domain-containing protein [Actinomycetales bacterium]
MTRSLDERLSDVLEAISRARVADERLQLAQTQGDHAGVQMAFDSILHNRFVIGEAVKAIPVEVLEQEPQMPWGEIAAMRDVIGHHYHRIAPAIIHRTVEADLGPLEAAIQRLQLNKKPLS